MHLFIAAFPKILRPHLVDRRWYPRDSHRLAQKRRFFSIAFNKMNFGAGHIRERTGDRHSGKSST